MEKARINFEVEPEVNKKARTLLPEFQKAESISEKQRIVNEIFDLKRRDELVSSADEDIKGHKVVYYRQMGFKQLEMILKNGRTDSFDYLDHPEQECDLDDFKKFLIRECSESLEEKWSDIGDIELEELMLKLFPSNKDEIKSFLENPSQKAAMDFVSKNVDQENIKDFHTGSLYQKYSSWLSASVGGLASIHGIWNGRVAVEMVIPTEEVELKAKTRGEKEVLLEEVRLEWVTRAFYQFDQLIKEGMGDKRLSFGDFALSRGGVDDSNAQSVIEKWRFDEPTADCLPVALREEFSKLEE